MGELQDFDGAVEQGWREFRGRLADRMAVRHTADHRHPPMVTASSE